MTQPDLAAYQASRRPAAPALAAGSLTLTWTDLDARTADTASRLAASGVRPGQRVAIPLGTNPDSVAVLFALSRLGAIMIPLAPQAPGAEHDALVGRAHADHVLTLGRLGKADPDGGFVTRPVAGHEAQAIVFTSGSTGKPKGTILTRANLEAGAHASADVLHLTAEDRWLACLPFHHVGGLSVFIRSGLIGFPVITVPNFDAATVSTAIDRNEATVVSLVPTMLHRMLDDGWKGAPTLRVVLLGGAPCPEPLLDEALARDIPVAPTYGLTEAASQVTTLPPWEVKAHRGTYGRSLPGTLVRIGETPESFEAPGTPGPIWVAGLSVARASLEGPITDERGWLATGDIGAVDADSYLSVIGRADDVILSGGEKVVPSEVEAALVEHADVREAAVIGVADPEWGEQVVAVVTPTEGSLPDGDDLRAYLKERLEPHKVPRRIIVIHDELPRTGPAKIDRVTLKRLASSADEGD
ncbi:MAG: class I adenylate-forming enzyme family protein [Actinomycetota bacterium]